MKIRRVIISALSIASAISLTACHKPSAVIDDGTETQSNPAETTTKTTQSSTTNPVESTTEPVESTINPVESTSTEPTTTTTPVEPIEDLQNGSSQGAITSGSGEVVLGNITSCSGLVEAAYIEYTKSSDCDGYNVYLKNASQTNYSLLDYNDQYTQALSDTKIRTDIFGLASGDYSIKVVPYKGATENEASKYVCNVSVTEYDRSGYAHFNYNEGVGAYNDDGTLKDNAIVIYVTDANKNTIMKDICEKYSDIDMFKVPSYFTNDYADTDAESIGWWLNNAQYTKAEKDKNGVVYTPQAGKKTSDTYDPNGRTLGFYSVCENHPICIRFVGTVTNPLGNTAYNSYKLGGSEDDNGNMARMRDLRNLTLEGVGNDAIIDGWGFHFMAGEAGGERGKNFEVRNLTFINYTEDALGMEGSQVSDTKYEEGFKAPVNHCWVHNNTFFPGYCASPAESDKGEGDGSCDFKRGYAFTMSYNYFEYCHKTNLIGSSKTSIQYDVSFHHNIWYNCGSRIPLVRQSNIHFYNNLVLGDSNKNNVQSISKIHNTSVSKVSLSYVSSLRASSYMYSENNYFDGCKNPFETGEGSGAAKCFGNVYVSCYGSIDGNVEVENREQKITNSCKNYSNPANVLDYSEFDTNPNYFYYDEINKVSDCYLTTATIAREECLKYAGSNYRTVLDGATLKVETNANKYTPTSAINLSSSTFTLAFDGNKSTGERQGIYFAELTGATSTEYKFKNQGITFIIDTPAQITLEITSSVSTPYSCGYLVKADGTVIMSSSGVCVIEPGTYFITSVYTDKETKVTNLVLSKYDSSEYEQKVLDELNEKIELIPNTITYNESCWEKIYQVKKAYNALSAQLKAKVSAEALEAIQKAYDSYKELGEASVAILIEKLGIVTSSSSADIIAAKTAYNQLLANCPDAIISNYQALVEAEAEFSSLAIDACIEAINEIGEVTLSSKSAIDNARSLYELVDNEQKEEITNYSILVQAEALYNDLSIANAFDNMVAACDNSIASYEAILARYDELTPAQITLITKLAEFSFCKIKYTIALIDAIGDVTSTSQQAITKARNAYNSLSAIEQSSVTNYDTLTTAETLISDMTQEYIKSWNVQTEVLSNKSCTTKDGFVVSAQDISEGSPKLKNTKGNSMTLSSINSSNVIVKIAAKFADTSSASQGTLLVTYSDNTTEEISYDVVGSKSIAVEQIITINNGKTVSSISLIGSKILDKNVIVESVVVIYVA